MWQMIGFRLGTIRRSSDCPNCGSAKVYRSRRKNLLERTLLRALFLHPYRCSECDDRHFGLGLGRESADQPQTLPSDTPHALKG
jgi:predicted RNA-binding Zn-ribbon protein involved in translation (DUF1610 family)